MYSNSLSRRSFLAQASLAAAALGLPSAAPAADESKRKGRPNILVIMTDEHNASVMGCAGNPIIHTPNLDGLAKDGVMFDACYCASPLCVPSRLSFTTGKYASRVGAWNNDCELSSPDYPSLPAALNSVGYESFLCGKMHYAADRRYGFKEIGGNFNTSIKTNQGVRRDPDDLAPTPGISERFNEFHTADSSHGMDHDLAVTKGVLGFLKDRKQEDAPFFLLAGYICPHFPLLVPEKYWEEYKGKVPMPVIPEGYLDKLPRNYKHLRVGFNVEDVPEDMVRKGRELYYGLVQWTDEQIGGVLRALAASGMAENTVVIYTADHGENMGEHGLWWKNCVFDTADRVPLIMRWPGRWTGGQRRTEACSLLDVVQTIADIGHADMPKDCNGDSMLGWLDHPDKKWKDRAVSEYYAHNIASGYAMIRMGQYKYVYHTPPDAEHSAERELYDLKADPGELNNLAAQPEQAERTASMHAALIKEIGENPDETEQRFRRTTMTGNIAPKKNAGKKNGRKNKSAGGTEG